MDVATLKQWFIEYLRFKDAYLKAIKDITEDDAKVIVVYKTKTHIYYITPEILFDNLNDDHMSLVCLNTKKNLQALIANWDTLTKYPKLSIYFVNPKASGDTKWIIHPKTHHSITESTNLKLGLESLFNNVEKYQ